MPTISRRRGIAHQKIDLAARLPARFQHVDMMAALGRARAPPQALPVRRR
jgi:hypothetical protein